MHFYKNFLQLGKMYIFCTFLSFLVVSPEIIYGETLEKEFSFDKSNIEVTKTKENYDLITLKDCIFTLNVGEPKLPMKLIHMIVPPNTKDINISVMSFSKEELDGDYYVFPVQPDLPAGEQSEFVPPNPEIYSLTEEYPGKLAEKSGIGSLDGCRILGLKLYLFQYLPQYKKIIFYNHLKIRIEIVEGESLIYQVKKRSLKIQEQIENSVAY